MVVQTKRMKRNETRK